LDTPVFLQISRQEGTSSSVVSFADLPEEDSSTGDPASSEEMDEDDPGEVCVACVVLCVLSVPLLCFLMWLCG
jgi:hypothetical protein